MYKMTMPGGLYARFTTPGTQISDYTQVVRDTWITIFDEWLPASEYEFDEARYDFKHYDERDHMYEGKDWAQMDIFIPVQKR
ncbi:GyrI-like domain-containing protein [Chloroflexota bacterium]